MAAFPPLIGREPTLLLLGSMPGQASLMAKQYYAHPRNAFWPIMSELFGVSLSSSYVQRVTQLIDARVAVWDVLHDCERPGSLDQKIVTDTEQANDFQTFFDANPSIQTVGFNGRAARAIFARHCKSLYHQFAHIRWVDLPSTSPAHAAMSLDQKIDRWRQQLMLPA